MKQTLKFSAFSGLVWGGVATALLGGFSPGSTFFEGFLMCLGGIPAGIAAGWCVVACGRSKVRPIRQGLAGYYGGIIAYWIVLFVLLRLHILASTSSLKTTSTCWR